MKLIKLASILLLFGTSAMAQKISVMGVKRVDECKAITKPLIVDLIAIDFPKDWRVIVACTAVKWQQVQQQADAFTTDLAFTSLQQHFTVINGTMYLRPEQFLVMQWHHTPKSILQHELGHIRCQCKSEDKADKAGGVW